MTATDTNPTTAFPVIDLARWRDGDPVEQRAVADLVDAALSTSGFLIVTGHGVADEVIEAARSATLEVFALPTDAKAPYRQADGIGAPGWIPVGAEANAYAFGETSPPDLKESWSVAPVGEDSIVVSSSGLIAGRNLFPAEVPGFEPAIEEYLDATLRLTRELFELLGSAVGEPDAFVRQCSEPMHTLNLTWYPPLPADSEVAPGQWRIGPHCDFGTITVLHREESDPPLQVQLPEGEWLDLPHVPDAFVINVGDLLAHWSGGRWRSNPHRIPAPTGSAAREGRLSLVLFVETDEGAALTPLGTDDEPLDAVEFLRDKLAAIDTALP